MAIDKKYGKIDIPGIPDEEPIFVIRGQDALAEHAVHHYSEMCARHGRPLEFIQSVNEAALTLSRWPNKKMPD